MDKKASRWVLWPNVYYVVLIFSAFLGCSDASHGIKPHVKISDNQVEVTLQSNPSTGYQWTVKQYDHSLLRLEHKSYQSNSSDRMGAAGNTVFTFAILKHTRPKEKTKIVFRYARSWESTGSGQLELVNVSLGRR